MYRKSRRMLALERKRKRCAAMRAAKERKRLAERFDGPEWTRWRTLLLAVWAHRDGRHVGLWVDGKPFVCGSERAARAALAKTLYGDSLRAAPVSSVSSVVVSSICAPRDLCARPQKKGG
jgi:hypothetical protein